MPLDVEEAVRDRYGKAALAREAALCCPVSYDPKLLAALPAEILERDYGCGDPSEHVRPGETVLDLGSGGGKICYLAAQVVGAAGRVIGIDANDDMLDLARRHQAGMAAKLGFANVEFRKGRIQDLRLSLDAVEARLRQRPIKDAAGWAEFEAWRHAERAERPLVADGAVDVVVSNCVLNLVRTEDKAEMFREMHRVLKPGGRAAISDIVCDEDVPLDLQRDPDLWSGCISGAFREDAFLAAFAAAGFVGMTIAKRDAAPWQTVAGLEFRSMTVVAWKGRSGPCLDRNQAVVYRGPWREVVDDAGNVFRRGVRHAVCGKTFEDVTRGPYAAEVIGLEPAQPVPPGLEQTMLCGQPGVRSAAALKGASAVGACCGPSGSCC